MSPTRRDVLGAAAGAVLADAALAATGTECVFCRIVAGAEPAVVVHRDADTIAFGALHPRMPGHVLVAPLAHLENLYDVHEPLAGRLLGSAAHLARTLKRVLRADGITLVQNNEPAGDQTVFHLHFHVIPRYAGRPLWRADTGPVAVPIAERERVLAPVRAALR